MSAERDYNYKYVLSSLNILRKVTRIIKIAPFIYTLVYIVFMVMQMLGMDSIMTFMESMCYMSPLVIVTLFILSHMLKLCCFYRFQCLLTAAPQILVVVDSYFYEFGTLSVYTATALLTTMLVLSMINITQVFFSE